MNSLPVYVIIQASRPVSSLLQRTLNAVAWQRGGTPVVSILIVQLNAAGLGWFELNSCWHAESQLSLSEAMLLQLDTSSVWVAGRLRTYKRLDSFLLHSCPTLCIVRWFTHTHTHAYTTSHPHTPSLNFPLITFYSRTLTHCKKDAAPTLQVVSGEVHA